MEAPGQNWTVCLFDRDSDHIFIKYVTGPRKYAVIKALKVDNPDIPAREFEPEKETHVVFPGHIRNICHP